MMEVSYEFGENGEHLVVFTEKTEDGLIVRCAVDAELIFSIAHEMCAGKFDTLSAWRYLESQGYEVKKPPRGWCSARFGSCADESQRTASS